MVMDLMQGGELFDYVVDKGTLSEAEASVIVRKLTSAVAHMHDLNIIHRDLKPENLLLTSKDPSKAQVKLIDFGLAKIVSDQHVASSFLGTRGYLAPEMLQRHSYDKSIDMWALGVIVFVLLCGCLPFDDDSSRIATESDARQKFTLRFPRWAQTLSAPAKDLLSNLLDVNPKTRYTAQQALSHPWVTGRSVAANSYLTSPSMMQDPARRKELRSPMTPSMQAMRDKVMMVAGHGQVQGGIGATIVQDTRGRKNSL
jgi:serine/threonine protein kinase